MEEKRIYYKELPCYHEATEKQKRRSYGEPYFNLDELPAEAMQKEMERLIRKRGAEVSFETIQHDKAYFIQLTTFLKKKAGRNESFQDLEQEKWIRLLKAWMMENGMPLTTESRNVYGRVSIKIDRKILEEYLIYRMTENESNRSGSTYILRLRAVLESIGKIYHAPHLEKLFINTDIPPELDPEFKVYSDEEMKRLMVCITKLDEQIARCMVIHQMLGTRISDTLTLKMECLSKADGHDMIRIEQVKTSVYEKPVSREVAALIERAIEYTTERYGKTEYIFVDERNPASPLRYTTVKHKVLRMIQEENLRDDKGCYFRFNTHMFRHYYGVKLTELHLDDWTIARLLGHKRLNSVKHYRKMSGQLMADETRKVRDMMTEIIYANLDGWGAEYEQIRQNDRGKQKSK